MVVLGRNCHVVNYSGKTAEVHPFSPEYEALQVPIVDAVIQYDDPYSGETYMLVCKEALYVPVMKYNLIPPFLMREAGLTVDDLPKVQSLNPTKHHHSIHFPDENLRIPLRLHGVFSYFPSKKPLVGVLNDYNNKILFLTTGNINPHNKIYSENEQAMLDHEGNMIEKEDRRSYIVDAVVVLENMKCAAFVGEVETRVINNNLEDITLHNSDLLVKKTEEYRSVKEANIEANIIGNLAERMELDGKLSQLKMSIGSCNMHNSQYLEDASICTAATEASSYVSDTEDITSEKSVDNDYDTILDDDSVIDEILIAGTTYYKSKKNSTTADHLSKI